MNAKISVLVICVEAIIYLSLYNFNDCTFNLPRLEIPCTKIIFTCSKSIIQALEKGMKYIQS